MVTLEPYHPQRGWSAKALQCYALRNATVSTFRPCGRPVNQCRIWNSPDKRNERRECHWATGRDRTTADMPPSIVDCYHLSSMLSKNVVLRTGSWFSQITNVGALYDLGVEVWNVDSIWLDVARCTSKLASLALLPRGVPLSGSVHPFVRLKRSVRIMLWKFRSYHKERIFLAVWAQSESPCSLAEVLLLVDCYSTTVLRLC